MLDVSVLPAFLGVILVFLAPPGPDMTYMLAVGLQGGRAAAIRAILGIGTGMSVYAAAVALGLGAVAAAYPVALTVVKLAGAAYLLWLSVSTARTARSQTADAGEAQVGSRRWFLRGATVSLTNPKLILFFLAVLPRFLGHAQNTSAQLAMLGAVNVAFEVVLYGAVGVGASMFRDRFSSRRGAQRALHYLAAAVYLALALLILGEAAREHLG